MSFKKVYDLALTLGILMVLIGLFLLVTPFYKAGMGLILCYSCWVAGLLIYPGLKKYMIKNL